MDDPYIVYLSELMPAATPQQDWPPVPPELAADLIDRGIVMAGGGALLRGIDRMVAQETGLPVHAADDPLSAVAEGTGRVLQELQFLKRVSATS